MRLTIKAISYKINSHSKNRNTSGFYDLFHNLKFMKFGGPDGELAAANRYLSQRYSMPYKEVKGMLMKCIDVE